MHYYPRHNGVNPKNCRQIKVTMGVINFEVVIANIKPSKDEPRLHFNATHNMNDKDNKDSLMEVK